MERNAKPFLKWAGGKTQLLPELMKKAPKKFGKYIEPFIGGGAMFFSVHPHTGIIGDLNPELINVYESISSGVDRVIKYLKNFENTEEYYYKIRSMVFEDLNNYFAAARTIYLNRTCYNGLYRVNKKGGFNVPFGRYKKPNICQIDVLLAAADVLKGTQIIYGDYKDILRKTAKRGDFIFLDPPYLPISKYANFTGYTKEQFYEEDHIELASEVKRLRKIGCYVLLTNSNHPLVHELYEDFDIEIVSTRRNISSNLKTRTGEDVILRGMA